MELHDYSIKILKEIQSKSYIEILDELKVVYGLCGPDTSIYKHNGITYLPLNKENVIKYVQNATLLDTCIDRLIDTFDNPYHMPVFSKEELKDKEEKFLADGNFIKYKKKLIKNKRYFLETFAYGPDNIPLKDLAKAAEDHYKVPYNSFPKNRKIDFYRYGNNVTNYNIKLDAEAYKKEKSMGGNEITIFRNTYFGSRIRLVGLRTVFLTLQMMIEAHEQSYDNIKQTQNSEIYKELYNSAKDYIIRILYTIPRSIKSYKNLINLQDGKLGKKILAQSYDTDFYPWDTKDILSNKYENYKKLLNYRKKNINNIETECGIDFQSNNIKSILNILDKKTQDYQNLDEDQISIEDKIDYINMLDIEIASMYMQAVMAYPEYERRIEQERKRGNEYNPVNSWKSSLYFKDAESIEDVKNIFKNLAKKYHPDVTGDPAKFLEIKEEYEKIIQN